MTKIKPIPLRRVYGSAPRDLQKAVQNIAKTLAEYVPQWRGDDLAADGLATGSTYVASYGQFVRAAGTSTVKLPDARELEGGAVLVKHTSAGTITVEPAIAGQQVEGSSSFAITGNLEGHIFISDGADWWTTD